MTENKALSEALANFSRKAIKRQILGQNPSKKDDKSYNEALNRRFKLHNWTPAETIILNSFLEAEMQKLSSYFLELQSVEISKELGITSDLTVNEFYSKPLNPPTND